MSQETKGILLESGTNELEIVEFGIGGEFYGINVMKVREIIQAIPPTKVPQSHPSMEGLIQVRSEVLPLIDLGKFLGYGTSEDPQQDLYIISEMNQVKVAFHVHTVSRIHRISWAQIEKPSDMMQGGDGSTVGIIKMDDRMILLLDFEKVVVDINPSAGIHQEQLKELGPRERSSKKVVIAEDSPLLRKLLEETLEAAGYSNLHIFSNGREAWEALEQWGPSFREQAQLLITDIEMPQMDGLHLTKRIKEHSALKDLPVIVFSSLISDDLRHKGEKVGANGQVSKPDIVHLIKLVDKLIL